MPKDNIKQLNKLQSNNVENPLWLSVSETAKLGGVQTKTIRRAIQSNTVKYKIVGNRYFIEFASIVKYLHKNTKLKNKFHNHGIGQYIKEWNI
jgi:excisionase family DNA binding protein